MGNVFGGFHKEYLLFYFEFTILCKMCVYINNPATIFIVTHPLCFVKCLGKTLNRYCRTSGRSALARIIFYIDGHDAAGASPPVPWQKAAASTAVNAPKRRLSRYRVRRLFKLRVVLVLIDFRKAA